MLNVLRNSFKNRPYLRVVLIIVAVSMVLSLAYFFDTGGGAATGNWAARVNGVEIPAQRFLDATRMQIDQYRQFLGDQFNDSTREMVVNQTLERMIEEEVIRQQAEQLGLVATPQAVRKRITEHPALQDASGQFIGVQQYRELIRRQIGDEAIFESDIADAVLIEHWTNIVTQPVEVGLDELRDEFRRRTVKTAADYVVVPASSYRSEDQPAEEDLLAWYEEHPERYERGESRRVRLVVVDRDTMRDRVTVDEEAIRSYYEDNRASYTHGEQRRASHILIRAAADADDADRQAARDRAEEALGRARAGEDFAELAASLSDDTLSAERGGDLDFFERGAMVKPFEDAAFGTPVGELAPVTESPFGFHVIQVTDQRPAGTTPLEDVRESIVSRLQAQRVEETTQEEAARIAAAVASADRLEEIANTEGLTIDSRVVSSGERPADLGAGPDFLPKVLALAPGAISEPLRVRDGFAVVAVDEAMPPSVAPFAEVRERVVEDVVAQRAREAAFEAARSALDKRGGLAAAAAALDLEVRDSRDLSPGQMPAGVTAPAPELQDALFGSDVAVGDVGSAVVPEGAVIYELKRSEPFDPDRFENERGDLRDELLAQRRGLYRQSVVERLMRQQEIERRRELLDRVLGRG